jgi:hypothetical protein
MICPVLVALALLRAFAPRDPAAEARARLEAIMRARPTDTIWHRTQWREKK